MHVCGNTYKAIYSYNGLAGLLHVNPSVVQYGKLIQTHDQFTAECHYTESACDSYIFLFNSVKST